MKNRSNIKNLSLPNERILRHFIGIYGRQGLHAVQIAHGEGVSPEEIAAKLDMKPNDVQRLSKVIAIIGETPFRMTRGISSIAQA